MALWNYCAICGKRIEVGEPCLGIEKENTEIVGDSICFDCVKVENINGLEKTVSITDLLARAEEAEKELAECREKNAGLALALLTEQPPNPDCLGDHGWQAVRNRVKEAEARAEKAERERDAVVELIGWIYYEACVSVEHDIRQHLDWLKDKIEQWRKKKEE